MCHVRTGQVKTGLDMREQVKSMLYWSHQVSSGNDRLSQIMSFYFKLGQIMTCHAMFG